MERCVLTVTEAADFSLIGQNKIRDLIKAGEIPAVYIGNGWKIPKELFIEWINEKAKGGERL